MDWRETRAGKRWLAANKVRVVECKDGAAYFAHHKRQRVKITWLARARLLSGKSVAQAAKACGLSPRSWERWEQGRSSPPGPALMAFVRHFGAIEMVTEASAFCCVNPATLEVLR